MYPCNVTTPQQPVPELDNSAEKAMIKKAAQKEIVPDCRAVWIDMHEGVSNQSTATLQLPHTTAHTLWVETQGWMETVNEEGQLTKMDE